MAPTGNDGPETIGLSDLVSTRWTKYGHDRVYVHASDGTKIGYWDNKTSTGVLVDEQHREMFNAAVATHGATVASERQCSPSSVGEPTSAGPPPFCAEKSTLMADAGSDRASSSGVVENPSLADDGESDPAEPLADIVPAAFLARKWTDLEGTRAGAAAREQALVLKQAAPVKTFLARVLGVKTDERAWRIGADGEEAVASRLAKLGAKWRVLHAVPVGENGSDIDHVVIGPGGVFTVNTKHHPKASVWVGGNTFMVNGTRVPYIRNSRFEGKRTAVFLSGALGGTPVAVVSVIAVMGATGGFTVKSQPPDGDVVVTTRREIAKWLAKQPARLTPDEVTAIYEVARRSDTWHK